MARQKKDWDEVIRIADFAFALDDTPNDPVERLVYIEGFAHTGDWEKAVELSQASYKVSKAFVGPLLCKLWDRIERETERVPEQVTAVGDAYRDFECKP